jgi:hypothetical protein
MPYLDLKLSNILAGLKYRVIHLRCHKKKRKSAENNPLYHVVWKHAVVPSDNPLTRKVIPVQAVEALRVARG